MKYHGVFKILGYEKGKPVEREDFFKNADSVEFQTDNLMVKWEETKEILVIHLSNVIGTVLIQETEQDL